MHLAILVSGTGSLMEAMIADGLSITLILADRPCRGLDVAKAKGVPTELVERSFAKDFDRRTYTKQVIVMLEKYGVDLVAMAGFMTVFDPVIFKKFPDRILNSHPSLLPAFKGDHAVRDALAAGVSETGTTIHIATATLDDGPILAQEKVPVLPTDTVLTLHERIKIVERRLYPAVIRAYTKTPKG
jgi:phosphoribosylglycinamide formyltransferase-1